MSEAAEAERPAEETTSVLGETLEFITKPTHHGLAIVVVDRGWVFVGDVTTDAEGITQLGFVHIKDARCVRRWGTTEGLGELAKKGPRPNTRLDAPTDVKISARALIAIVPCEPDAWNA